MPIAFRMANPPSAFADRNGNCIAGHEQHSEKNHSPNSYHYWLNVPELFQEAGLKGRFYSTLCFVRRISEILRQ